MKQAYKIIMSEPVKLEPQIGKSVGADFEDMTWTFEMPKKFSIRAGEFVIIPKEDYAPLPVITEEKYTLPTDEEVWERFKYQGYDTIYRLAIGEIMQWLRDKHSKLSLPDNREKAIDDDEDLMAYRSSEITKAIAKETAIGFQKWVDDNYCRMSMTGEYHHRQSHIKVEESNLFDLYQAEQKTKE